MDVIINGENVHEIAPSSAFLEQVLNAIYPIGSFYMSTLASTPSIGTWVPVAEGRVLIGAGTSDQTFVAGATDGASNVTLTGIPSHSHSGINVAGNTNIQSTVHLHTSPYLQGAINNDDDRLYGFTNTVGTEARQSSLSSYESNGHDHSFSFAGNTVTVGDNIVHNNLPPFVVANVWRRTA